MNQVKAKNKSFQGKFKLGCKLDGLSAVVTLMSWFYWMDIKYGTAQQCAPSYLDFDLPKEKEKNTEVA